MTEEECDELRRREVAALERLAGKRPAVRRVWSDWWHGVPVGQEHVREHYKTQHMRVRY